MNYMEAREIIKPLIRCFTIPEGRSVYGPYIQRREYRGGVRYAVGYSWTRRYSHHLTGRVYDTALAFGGTIEEAVEALKKRAAAQGVK